MIFLLLSLGFWYLQTLQDEYEIEIAIPVKYKNVPADKILTGDNPQEIMVRVRDRGTVLINYSFLRTFAPIEVDVKALQKAGGRRVTVTRRVIETNIAKQLISSTSLLSFEPSSIQVEYNDLLNKLKPVVADLSITLEPGFQLSDTVIVTPPKVRVYAARAILDSLLVVKTVALKAENLHKTKEFTVGLQPIEGVRYEPEEVKVSIPVEEYTEKRLTLSIQCDSVPANYLLRMFPSTVELSCKLPLSRFKEISEEDFEIRLPFNEFEAHREAGELPVRLTKQPDRLLNLELTPQKIEFILEQK
ncbi:MAG: YbbR-like domain-containing protein [Tannerella sp.]|nr:YbbR-like domain-containing protein [Tannerella sp.]